APGEKLGVGAGLFLAPRRVPQRPRDEQATPGDGQDDVGPVAVVGDHLGELAACRAEERPGEALALAHARTGRWDGVLARRSTRAAPQQVTRHRASATIALL